MLNYPINNDYLRNYTWEERVAEKLSLKRSKMFLSIQMPSFFCTPTHQQFIVNRIICHTGGYCSCAQSKDRSSLMPKITQPNPDSKHTEANEWLLAC